MNSKLKHTITFFSVVFVLIGYTYLLSQYSPEEITKLLGITDGYMFALFISLIAGFSSVFSTTVFVAVYTLANANFNPIILGICAGFGLAIGDGVFFYLGHKGKKVISGKMKIMVDKVLKFIENRKKSTIQFFLFLYISFVPMSNDIVLIPLGYSKFRYRDIVIITFVGNIIAVTLFAYLSVLGYNYLVV